jgi:hypothetical protein
MEKYPNVVTRFSDLTTKELVMINNLLAQDFPVERTTIAQWNGRSQKELVEIVTKTLDKFNRYAVINDDTGAFGLVPQTDVGNVVNLKSVMEKKVETETATAEKAPKAPAKKQAAPAKKPAASTKKQVSKKAAPEAMTVFVNSLLAKGLPSDEMFELASAESKKRGVKRFTIRKKFDRYIAKKFDRYIAKQAKKAAK